MLSRKTYFPLFVLIAIVSLVSLACNFGRVVSEQAQSGAETVQATAQAAASTAAAVGAAVQPTAEALAATAQAVAPTAVAEVQSGEGPSVQSIVEGLDQLPSYRYRFTMSFEGKDDQGNLKEGSMEMLQERVSETKDSHISITTQGLSEIAQGAQAVEIYQIGDVSYMISDGTCLSFSGADTPMADTAMFNQDDLVGDINNLKLAERNVMIYGIETNHYTLDETAFSGQYKSASGDIWLATDGDYVVKFAGTAEGSTGLTTGEGTINWTYDLEQVGNVEVVPPDTCQAPASSDIPTPANATQVTSLGSLLTFTSPDPINTVADFYRTELAKLGWTEGDGTSMDQLTILKFTKDAQTLDVTITADAAGCTVMIIKTP